MLGGGREDGRTGGRTNATSLMNAEKTVTPSLHCSIQPSPLGELGGAALISRLPGHLEVVDTSRQHKLSYKKKGELK